MSNALELVKQRAGAGLDTLDTGSSLPLIKILQKGCAEVDETHKNFATKGIEGAKCGDLLFSEEALILEKPVEFLPLGQTTLYVEWRPKNQGGGIVASHPLSIAASPEYRKDGFDEYLGQNDLTLTMYFCILFRVGDEWKKGILSFASTNLKHARALVKQIKSFRYPEEQADIAPFIFSRSFLLDTRIVHGDENSWYEFSIQPNRVLDFEEDAELIEEGFQAFDDAQASLPQPQQEVKSLAADEDVPF